MLGVPNIKVQENLFRGHLLDDAQGFNELKGGILEVIVVMEASYIRLVRAQLLLGLLILLTQIKQLCSDWSQIFSARRRVSSCRFLKILFGYLRSVHQASCVFQVKQLFSFFHLHKARFQHDFPDLQFCICCLVKIFGSENWLWF